MASLITMQEFWTLTDTSLSVDGFLTKYLSPASDQVTKYCGTTFGVQSITNEKRMSVITGDGDLRVDFRIKPVVSLSSIHLVWGESRSELTLSIADLFRPEGYILIPFTSVTVCASRVSQGSIGAMGYLTRGDQYITESTYTGGAAVPENVKMAIALLAWEDYLIKGKIKDGTDPAAAVVKSFSIGQYSETRGKVGEGAAEMEGTLGWGTALSTKAEGLLTGYVKGGALFLGFM